MNWNGSPLVTGLAWNALGQPTGWSWAFVAPSLAASRSYNTAGQLTTTEFGSYVYDAAGRITSLTQKLYRPASTNPAHTTIALGNVTWAVPIVAIVNGTSFAVHSDHLNTPRRMTNSDGQPVWQWSYSAFGDEKPTIAKNRFANLDVTPNPGTTSFSEMVYNVRYPGMYQDKESGLAQNWFRYYDSRTGRYTQGDPIGLGGGWNVFGYANLNPLMYTDPMGLMGVGGGGSAGPGVSSPGQVTSDCSEWQFSAGISGSAGFSPVFVPSGFIGGGLGVGFTSNGSVFVQAQATGSFGAGIFAGVGIQGGVSRSEAATPAGMSTSQSLQADFNFGAGPSVGGSVQWAPGNGGGAQGPLPGTGRLGVGYGFQASGGMTQTTTIATPPLFSNRSCGCRK